ncbi:flagellar biosynthetic protein FliO [Candidatus Rubidus massiliensis]|nr:MAG: hypothetical protein BGO10_04860 [Chlamydia sp. 32-24]CDZ80968.1 flagellar biosynthetic protein FliO [Candidatus Rubidus massiliensis]
MLKFYLPSIFFSILFSSTFSQEIPLPSPPEADRFMSEFFHMLLTLGFIVAFLLLAAYGMKKFLHTRMHQINANSEIKILESRALSTKTTLYVVEVKGHHLTIAESGNGVTLLSKSNTKQFTMDLTQESE